MARRQADQIYNLSLTRTATVTLGRDAEGVIGIGRVKTPPLAIACRREIEIREFVPVGYFAVVATAEAGGRSFRMRHAPKPRILKREDSRAVLDAARDFEGRLGVRVEDKRQRPPRHAARLMTIPGIGPITAMALQALAPPLESFRRGRDFAAWLGLLPRQHTTGGKPRLGGVSKRGQRDLRRLLITGAMAVVRHADRWGSTPDPWLARMLARKPRMLVAVALANRMARIAWAVMTTKQRYRVPAAA